MKSYEQIAIERQSLLKLCKKLLELLMAGIVHAEKVTETHKAIHAEATAIVAACEED